MQRSNKLNVEGILEEKSAAAVNRNSSRDVCEGQSCASKTNNKQTTEHFFQVNQNFLSPQNEKFKSDWVSFVLELRREQAADKFLLERRVIIEVAISWLKMNMKAKITNKELGLKISNSFLISSLIKSISSGSF